ncbi:MAG: ABC transporter substrate-binding protein [Thermoanaerobaculia bacterium]
MRCHRALGALGLVLAALAGGSCRKPEPPLRIAVHSAPIGYDPHLQNESLTSAILANLYDALTEFDEELGVRPALAVGWRNPDERTWVFSIRPSVRFHDGRILTADDVVFSLERARESSGTGIASYLVEVERVRALGPLSVEVRTYRPFAPLLSKLAMVSVVPRGAPETITTPVGTGSYRLARSDATRIEMARAPRTWRGDPRVGTLVFVVVPSPAERLRLLLAGDVDVAADLDESAVAALGREDCCRSLVHPGSTIEYLHLSDVVVPFRDRRVREAADLAVDRPLYVAQAHGGLGQPVGQMAAPGVFGHAPGLRPPLRDLARARGLLAEAGFPRGIDVELEHRPGRRADLIAAQLAEAGIRATPRESPWPDLYRRLQRGEVGFYFGGLVSPTAEASDFLDGYAHTRDEARGYGASNHARYSSTRADALIEEASACFDLATRRDLLQRAMGVVAGDRRFVPVASPYQVFGVRRGVEFRPRFDMKLLGREIARR